MNCLLRSKQVLSHTPNFLAYLRFQQQKLSSTHSPAAKENKEDKPVDKKGDHTSVPKRSIQDIIGYVGDPVRVQSEYRTWIRKVFVERSKELG